jgi:hypothetical protein
MSNQPNKINVDKMFSALMTSANHIIDKLETLDPTTEQYGHTLENLARVFTILSGATLKSKGDTDGEK